MEFKPKIESKNEIIYDCSIATGIKKNLAANSGSEEVFIVYESLTDVNATLKDKPTNISLVAKNSAGTEVTITLKSPKKPWDTGITPETFNLIGKLITEGKYDDINKLFLIQER
ncbi:hypothetical protein [Ferruginibacter sp. SUN106]|uniref:hypothetical protein n=1 Tax=Ferruginibacter sp. SUN106 TaxID=2978348 RepID=UPI003D36F29A